EADGHGALEGGFVTDDGDAADLVLEVFLVDGGLHLFEVEDGGDGLEFAGGDDPFAGGIGVDAVRGLGHGQEVEDAGNLGGIDQGSIGREPSVAGGKGGLGGALVEDGGVV